MTLTPTAPTGSAVTLAEITGIGIGREGQAIEHVADAGSFAKLIRMVAQKRTIKIATADVAKALSLVPNTVYTIAATLGDAKNGTGTAGGGITVTVTGCILVSDENQGETNKFGSASLTFQAFASDGATDPLTVVAL